MAVITVEFPDEELSRLQSFLERCDYLIRDDIRKKVSTFGTLLPFEKELLLKGEEFFKKLYQQLEQKEAEYNHRIAEESERELYLRLRKKYG